MFLYLNRRNYFMNLVNSLLNKKKILIWTIGTDGQGSSEVVRNLIQSLYENDHDQEYLIVISNKSLLSEKLYQIKKNLPKKKSIKLIRFHKIIKFYPFNFLIRCFINPDKFFKATFVLDDFPFRLSKKQLLYFHQPNIIFPKSFSWKIKRSIFRLLLNKKTKVYLQTNHFFDLFVKNFPFISNNSITFLHDY